MHITYTEEQTMLQESAEKFLRDNYSFDHRQSIVKSDKPFCADMWQTFAELGWLMLPFSEEDGGFGGGALELMLMGENFGRQLVLEPYLETVVIGGGLIAGSGNSELKTSYLEALMGGELQVAFAYAESGCGLPGYAAATQAVAESDGFSLRGSKSVVLNGPAADLFIVSASVVGEGGATGLFAVPADARGLSLKSYPTYDGRVACELTLENVSVRASAQLVAVEQTVALVNSVINSALVFVCAEAVGAMDALIKATVEYTSQRKQFGQPIARFQVLRHRMVDMYIEAELSRSILMATAWHIQNSSEESDRLVAALKAKIGKAARYVSQNAIQLHGGIGVTDELNIGHYFKRMAVIDNLFGARDYHLKRFSELT